MAEAEEVQRIAWVVAAQSIVERWEQQAQRLMLTTREATLLTELVANGLQEAYERGRAKR